MPIDIDLPKLLMLTALLLEATSILLELSK